MRIAWFGGVAITTVFSGSGPAPAGTTASRAAAPGPRAEAVDVRGAWRAERYLLKDGHEYPVRGQILFTENNWSVLFFVIGPDGTLQRGSAEAGSYTITGDQLVFTHFYLLTNEAPAIPGLKAQALRLRDIEPDQRPREPVTVERHGDQLTIHFGPSGNHMSFVRIDGE